MPLTLIGHHITIKHELHVKLMKTHTNWYLSLVMPSDIQVHRQVPLNDASISETTKLALNNLL